MNILFVSSEVVPFAKTGGLADVIGALPEALAKKGHTCGIILPFYSMVKKNGFAPKVFKKGLTVKINGKNEIFNLLLLKQGNIDVYFIEKDEYYNRDQLYGTPQGDYPDNAFRFGFFAKAVIAAVADIGSQDILHCNDWQSALIPLYVKLSHKDDPLFNKTKILFTIHNMAYQGIFSREVMLDLGLEEDLFTPDLLEFYGKLNFMKAGIIYSDAVSTVSKGYSREILTPEFSAGLDGLLRTREKDLYGIVNGVDYSIWNPSTDKFIAANYSEKGLAGKEECKKDILKECGIKYNPKRPLIGMITRFAEQKGIDLVAQGMANIIKMGCDFVILGFGDEKYNNIFSKLNVKHRGHMAALIKFDNSLAHKIEAGSDMFLMPSRYEPCGLNQLYSLKYATVPIVRAVGGLEDTVENFDIAAKKGNGFKFKDASCRELLNTVKTAVAVFKNKAVWNTLLKNCLACDYSWDSSAEQYEKLYDRLLA
jgi:starch synthase